MIFSFLFFLGWPVERHGEEDPMIFPMSLTSEHTRALRGVVGRSMLPRPGPSCGDAAAHRRRGRGQLQPCAVVRGADLGSQEPTTGRGFFPAIARSHAAPILETASTTVHMKGDEHPTSAGRFPSADRPQLLPPFPPAAHGPPHRFLQMGAKSSRTKSLNALGKRWEAQCPGHRVLRA